MEFFFLNPWAMVAGGLLVSSPIIIHLINRMRFRRIRWAAMEFLLKSQKRNRRRLIIEQLILLLLRILIVLLIAFLLARLVFGSQTAGQSTLHVVVLDDTLSMTDRWVGDERNNSFDSGKQMIRDIAKNAVQANGIQQMKVYMLSDLEGEPLFNEQLTETTLDDLARKLETKKQPTALHLDPIEGLKKAQQLFQDAKESKHILHLVSDFRDTDWVSGANSKEVAEAVDHLVESGGSLTLADVTHPYRTEGTNLPQCHENLAILEFRAESKVVAEALPVEFTITIANYSPSAKSTHLSVKVNGVEDFLGVREIKDIPPYGKTTEKFTLILAKAVRANDVAPARDTDPPEVREAKRMADREFKHISADITAEKEGLLGDNIRDLVLEVRRKVPALVIDGNQGSDAVGPGGDLFHMEVAFTAARSYEAEKRPLADLGKINLDLYPTIYLLNVPTITDEKALQKLDNYVKKGGSVVYFLGDKVQAPFYNETLHKAYGGLFPVLLAPRPTEPLTDDERVERIQKDEQPKILFPDKKDEMISSLAPFESWFRLLLIDRYWPTAPRFQWLTTPEEPVRELIVLPNRSDVHDKIPDAQRLMKDAIAAANNIAENEKPEAGKDKVYDRYPAVLESFKRELNTALQSNLYQVSVVFDKILNDSGNKTDVNRPDMGGLWSHPGMKKVKGEIETFVKTIRYGDPLVVSRKHGEGRVVAVLTPAGTLTKWNDWGGGSAVSWTFPVFIMDMQRVLTKQHDDLNHLVGEKVHFTLDKTKYKNTVAIGYQAQPDVIKPVQNANGENRPPLKDLGVQTLLEKDKMWDFDFNNTKNSGYYVFTFTREDGGTKEPVHYAFNVDAQSESDLRRTDKEKLVRNKAEGSGGKRGVIKLVWPGADLTGFKARVPDFSESPWLFLFILVVLIAEQAMAVHLSHHLRGAEGTVPVPASGQAAAAGKGAAAA